MITIRWIVYFLQERMAWITIFVIFDILLLVFTFLDDDLPFDNIWYIIGVKWLVTIFFLIYRFFKETKYYQHLESDPEIEAVHHHLLAETPFEQMTLRYLRAKITQLHQSIAQQQYWIDLNEQSMTEFVHDIKTPITALKLLIEKESDFVRRKQLMYEWSRIDYMLDQHLFLARLNHQAHDMFFEKVTLRELVINEIHQLRHIAILKGLGFNVDIPEMTMVYTDKRWMRMVIRQIISNAVKYSEHADIDISQTIENQKVRLHIQDYGSGIAKQDMPRIFQRGFAGKNSAHLYTSSGMGLYLVESVREALGLQIDIVSVVDEGTTVSLTFPQQNDYLQRMSGDKTVT
ncbi:sensor histidine kinase [Staphylococcus lutrae]|uniref:histidine kinase n=1 Tax=Staphylococcus lutrae TaxID=155085 RepID=A0AAC9RT53_9STAP|nr:sensor histidine kinase [Staphylococcus lutrae]ARJ51206.1 ATP-binding protein [Staphylococcus lutrae]PNZ39451.1 sensor histidine kinase [Staphylococcus lutrae]